jgi:GT2 family glycosyltransferase
MPSMNEHSVCIAVCTRNRADSLRSFLQAASQLVPPRGWSLELLIIDNGSTDATQSVFRESVPLLPMRASIHTEPRAGLSVARNAALRACTADVIAFTDDDCLPQTDWIASVCARFDQLEGAPAILGGRVELHNPLDLPMTINTSREPERLETPTFNLSSFLGCNLAVARKVVQHVGAFDETLGAGARFKSAEDWDYLYRALQRGFTLLYCPEIAVFHNHGRRSARDRASLRNGYAFGAGALYFKHWQAGDSFALKSFYWCLVAQLKALVWQRPGSIARADCVRYLWFVGKGFLLAAWLNRRALKFH